jgi:hypothetical protein
MNKKMKMSIYVVMIFAAGMMVGKSHYASLDFFRSLFHSSAKTKQLSTFESFYVHKSSLFKMLASENSTGKYKIAMLGDSITDWGEWNELLKRDDVINRGISGDTTEGVLKRLDGIDSGISKVFILLGVNDLGKGKSVDEIFENYKKIIFALEEKKMQPVIQSTLYVNPSKNKRINNKDIEALNAKLKKFALEQGLTYIDLNQKLSKNKSLRADYTYDGLHLNAAAYRAWKEYLIPYL